ncbi:MAG: hypothetical protein H6757_03085 [Candidatus Omnitrophica bacterium]|nr:hypothetical protein [Candidatus Omnitrophota bacterium]
MRNFYGKKFLREIYTRYRSVPGWMAYQRIDREALKEKHNLYAGARCFIVANGASLRRQDLSFLRNEYVFAMNWFVLHPEFNSMRKLFFCMGDKRFWTPSGLLPGISERLQAHPGLICLFDHTLCPAAEKDRLRHPVHYVWINTNRSVWAGQFQSDITRELCWGWSTVVDICLPAAFYMGFKNIYLLGCDCDYRLDRADDFSQSYFYSIDKLPEDDRRRLQEQKNSPEQYNQTGILPKSYQTVKDYFEQHGRKIYNAGAGGSLDVFKRVNYEGLFSGDRESQYTAV